MVNRLIHHLGRPPYVLHRLDMNTSGVLVFAKEKAVVDQMAEQFRQRTAKKSYLAICIGIPLVQSGEDVIEIRAPIGHHPTVAVARVTYDGNNGGALSTCDKGEAEGGLIQSAWTSVKVLSTNPDFEFGETKGGLLFSGDPITSKGCALVECWPHTGRTHQIRVHMQHIGHPLVGDELYGIEGPWIKRQVRKR